MRILKNALGVFIALGLTSAVLMGQSTTWTGNADDGNQWSTPGNWSTGLPDPDTQARFLGGSFDGDNPLTVNVDSPQTLRAMNFANTDNQILTIGGSPLLLQADGTTTSIVWNTSFSGINAPIIINSAVDYSNSVADTAALFNLGLSNPITFNSNITTSGTGSRQMSITGAAVITFNGTNPASFLSFGGSGEVIAGSTTALGIGSIQKTTSSALSLRSDVTVAGATYSWTASGTITQLRISELSASSVDRTLTFNNRTHASTGAMEFVDNINSSGNLIVEHKYSGATAQSLNFITNASAIIRFAQTASTTYSGIISGTGGRLEVTAGGTTTLSAANTYTGKTTVSNGTLRLSGDGTIQGTSELNLATGTTFDISLITPASYTFSGTQTLSGTGTITTGGKNILVEGGISPGNSPGTLTFAMGTGILSLGSDVDLIFELGTVSDLVLLSTGALNIGSGTLNFDNFQFTAIAGFGEDTYTLFQTSEAIQGFLGANTTGMIGSMEAEILIQGNNLVINVIPEPASTAFLLLGCLLLAARNRKKRFI